MSNKNQSVLIIDDTPMMLSALGSILKSEYNVLVAKSGEKGIEFAKKNNPDMILLDVMMPGMSGFEVIEILKADDATKDIPVIFLTGDDSADSKEKGLGLGAVDYIEKPFSEDTVRDRVAFNLKT